MSNSPRSQLPSLLELENALVFASKGMRKNRMDLMAIDIEVSRTAALVLGDHHLARALNLLAKTDHAVRARRMGSDAR